LNKNIPGNYLTVEKKPTKGFGQLLNITCRDFVQNDRANVELSAGITKHENLLQPAMTIRPISAKLKSKLLLEFQPCKVADVQNLSLFADIKTFCRNEAGVEYTNATKLVKSGDYNDADLLKKIWMENVTSRIDQNFKKLVSAHVKPFKKQKPRLPEAEIQAIEKKFYDSKKEMYQNKKRLWQEQHLPRELLAFVLCSAPGLDLITFKVGASDVDDGKEGEDEEVIHLSMSARRGQRETESYRNSSGSSSGGGSVSSSLESVKRSELQVKAALGISLANQKKIDNCKEFLTYLKEKGETDSDRYRSISAQYEKLMEESIFSTTNIMDLTGLPEEESNKKPRGNSTASTVSTPLPLQNESPIISMAHTVTNVAEV
jgi:hypothetical protein